MSSDFIEMISYLSENRFLRKVQWISSNKIPCAILFAPAIPQNYRQIIDSYKSIGININHVCVLTDEHKKFLQPADGETVVNINEFPNLPVKPKFIFVLERYFGTAFIDYFGKFGTNMFFLPYINDAENQYNFYIKYLPELYDVHEMLADDESKKIFRAAITGRITRLMQDFIYTSEYEYFLNGFLPEEGDIAIDGGALDGGTAIDFLRQGAKVYSFEMDANNYKNCLAPAKEYGFTIENLGLSNQESTAFYNSNGAGSRKLNNNAPPPPGGLVANFIDLDTYVERKNLPRVDYIKLDIEGSELDALHGAAKTITRWKPKMAICIYHKPEDLWTLPKYIKYLRNDYEFQFRHHYCDRREEVNGNSHWSFLKQLGVSYRTPSEYDMILYCR
ncbi:MAG: FkbM family methyltransferase [Selenomonadaceae bacterium]|nr:FkbM family methyltransferase [Selenomonadaceae bacterium]